MTTAEVNIRPEPTPNPATMRFVLDIDLTEGASVDFTQAAEAEGSPLPMRLFALEGVTGVLVGPRFVSVTAGEGTNWGEMMDQVARAIREHAASGEPAVEAGKSMADAEATSEIEQGIKRVVQDEVRPALAMDGGDCVYRGFDKGIVYLELRGACSGCPHSLMTLKMGIERRLQEEFPQIQAVETVM